MPIGQVAVALGLIAAITVGSADGAGADPAKPTNFRSRIVSITPPLPSGMRLRVVGGDAFLDLRVPRGHTATVPDYQSAPGTTTRPYLRFDPDGTVRVNDHSAASVANRSRYGATTGTVDVATTPRWRTVATNGHYVWHDHRIHLMLPPRLAVVDANGRVDLGGPAGTWAVEMQVDGRAVTVTGELLLLAAPSPLPWYLLTAAVTLAVVALAWRRIRAGTGPAYGAIATGLAVVAGAATIIGYVEWRTIPVGAGGSVLPAAIPAIGLVGALVAGVARQSATGPVRLAGLVAAVATLGCWGILRITVLDHAVLPSGVPTFDRATTAVAIGLAIAVGGLVVWRPPIATRHETPTPA